MYWPEYNPRKKKNSSGRGLAVLLTLVVSILIAGELNGWWQVTSLPSSWQAETVPSAVTATSVSDVVVIATVVPSAPTRPLLPMVSEAAAAPNFTLPDLYDSTRSRSLSDYAGKPVILNFWASWCVPCRAEMPAMQRAYELYSEDNLVVLGINQTFIDDLQAARAFVEELALTFPSVRDGSGEMSSTLYRIAGLPTSVFITVEGKIAHVQVGQMTDEQIDTYSQRLIAGEKITP